MNANLKNLRRRSGGWLAETVNPDGLEVCFDGTGSGPDPSALALAEQVLGKAAHFADRGIEYLRYFISLAHFDCKGEWEATGFDFGPKLLFPNADFTMSFGIPDSDTYGDWTVAYRNYDNSTLTGAEPFAFARTQL
jgi:hypothetical protein